MRRTCTHPDFPQYVEEEDPNYWKDSLIAIVLAILLFGLLLLIVLVVDPWIAAKTCNPVLELCT